MNDPDGDAGLTWREVVAEAGATLVAAGRHPVPHEIRWLFEEVTGATGAEGLAMLEELATNRRLARFDALLARLAAGEPIQYVIGHWPFRNLDLLVDRRVLIPRPETEEVAGWALAEVDRVAALVGADYERRLVVADLGTGSGAIALSLAQERPILDVWATDASADALAVARANLAGLGRAASRVRIAEGDWFAALPDELAGELAVIVTNPPYVAEQDHLPPEVADWEPIGALVSGPSGTEALDRIRAEAAGWLRPGGALVVELAPWQAVPFAAAAVAAGFTEAAVRVDLAGRSRAVVARVRPSAVHS